jgi:UDP-2,3-diacylglucosamine hydrolase
VTLASNKKYTFLSDFHLGRTDAASSLQREKQVVRFLDEIKNDAAEIFIVGDMFDFWYEYRKGCSQRIYKTIRKAC